MKEDGRHTGRVKGIRLVSGAGIRSASLVWVILTHYLLLLYF